MNDSGITCDEIMDMDSEAKSNDEAKRTTRKQKLSEEVLLEKDITCKIQNFYILRVFLLVTIAAMITVGI